MGSFQGRPQQELGVSSICRDASFINPIYLTNPEWTVGCWSKDQRMGLFLLGHSNAHMGGHFHCCHGLGP